MANIAKNIRKSATGAYLAQHYRIAVMATGAFAALAAPSASAPIAAALPRNCRQFIVFKLVA